MLTKDLSNIVLIGMPGSGKSTVGVILAKLTSRNFIDTDVLIQVSEGKSLQEIIDTQGHMALRKIEEKVLLTLNYQNSIIATGGSATYSHPAMTHLKSNSAIVFLDVDIETLNLRVNNFNTRGIAKREDQSFRDLFEERSILYKRYADISIKNSNLTQEEACYKIIKKMGILQK